MGRAVVDVDDPRFWHDRAMHALATAGRVVDPEIKRMLIDIGERYDAIAKLAAERDVVPQPRRRRRPTFRR
jgi:hypothetical protein